MGELDVSHPGLEYLSKKIVIDNDKNGDDTAPQTDLYASLLCHECHQIGPVQFQDLCCSTNLSFFFELRIDFQKTAWEWNCLALKPPSIQETLVYFAWAYHLTLRDKSPFGLYLVHL